MTVSASSGIEVIGTLRDDASIAAPMASAE